MFVVRYVNGDGETKFKASSRLAHAHEIYNAAWVKTVDGEFERVALYRVAGTENAREAVSILGSGEAGRVELLKLKERSDIEMAKLIEKLDLDI